MVDIERIRGRIIPEGDNTEKASGLLREEVLNKADELLRRRERGVFIEGRGIVPFVERAKELEARRAEKGLLPPAEEAELRNLKLKLEGPVLERHRNKK